MIDSNILLSDSIYSNEIQTDTSVSSQSETMDYTLIRDRLQEVGALLEKYRAKICQNQPYNLPIQLPSNLLVPIGEGISGSYFLENEAGEKKFVIKPICEEPGGVNNPKYFWNATLSNPIREDMPLYLSSLKEAATYELAVEVGLTSIAPKTALAIFESEVFYHTADNLKPTSESGKYILEEIQSFPREKLCSIQEVVPDAQPVFSLDWSNSLKTFSILSELCSSERLAVVLSCLEKIPYPMDDQKEVVSFLKKALSEISTLSPPDTKKFLAQLKIAKENAELSPTQLNQLERLIDAIEWEINRTNPFYQVLTFMYEFTPEEMNALLLKMIEKIPSSSPGKEKVIERLRALVEESPLNSNLSNDFFNLLVEQAKIARKYAPLETADQEILDKIIFLIELFLKKSSRNALLDQAQYEELVILVWLTYDTDAHTGNILAHKMNEDETGEPIFGLKKIDNGLSFPTRNRNLRNPIIHFPNSLKPLSDEGRKKILDINEEKLLEILANYGLDVVQDAFKERLKMLKTLVENPQITLQEINSRLEKLEYEDAFYTSWGADPLS